MNTRVVISIPLAQIDVGERLRAVDPDYARWIGLSMQERGQDTPIRVTEANLLGRYTLIAGAHRYDGAGQVGMEALDAITFAGSALEAELLQIEENLVRRELNPLDRAVFLARHKVVYQALHPGSGRGGDRKSDQRLRISHRSESFADSIKAKMGLSKASINQAIKIADRLPPDVRDAIAHMAISRSLKDLVALSKLVAFEQRQVVQVLTERVAESVVEALRVVRQSPAPVVDADEQAFSRLVQLWIKAGGKARQRFVAYLQDSNNLPGGKPAKAKRPARQDA